MAAKVKNAKTNNEEEVLESIDTKKVIYIMLGINDMDEKIDNLGQFNSEAEAKQASAFFNAGIKKHIEIEGGEEGSYFTDIIKVVVK